MNGTEMTSDNVNILSFGFGQLFNGRAIKIGQFKRAQRASAFIRFDRSRTTKSPV
jgi:hypothetical protein